MLCDSVTYTFYISDNSFLIPSYITSTSPIGIMFYLFWSSFELNTLCAFTSSKYSHDRAIKVFRIMKLLMNMKMGIITLDDIIPSFSNCSHNPAHQSTKLLYRRVNYHPMSLFISSYKMNPRMI